MPTKDGKHAYTDEEKAEIIAHILINVASGRFVSRIFREDDVVANGVRLPNQDTFWRWIFEDDRLPPAQSERLSEKLVRAREFGVEALLDETIDIADDGTNDFITKERDDGSEYEEVNRDHISRSKLRIETRIKLAQMLKPKKYGAKLDVTSDGEKINIADEIIEARKRLDEMRAQEEREE